MATPGIAAALILLGFFAALFLQVAIATRSLRKSWYLSIAYLAISAGVVVFLVSQHLDDSDRRDRLMLALAMPPGAPVQISDTTMLIEVSVSGYELIYTYEVVEDAVPPTLAEAMARNCQQHALRAILELGAVILHRFVGKSGRIQEVKVGRALCG